ncbi:cbb3-type cytochrome c oxidase subunit I [Peribacillus sp. B-H-3]|uniref:cbb3-type cytochrome c oxidase subunit I n=1 Tax=Peribacillus sp. B-H-3 TaxID=3400420 RepID=UPI003B023AC0
MGIRFLKISVIYFLIGIGFGMFMSISHKFQYAPSHAHINLLGWTSLALSGLIYALYPALAEKKLAKFHFWLHNIGLPVMMLGLIWLESGNSSVEPLIAAGATVMSLGIICFTVNVLKNLKSTSESAAKSKIVS